MSAGRVAVLCALLGAAGPAGAAPLDLAAYTAPGGALTVAAGGDRVDPYFALLALRVASRCGLDARGATRAFVRWLLPRQRPDGRFERYCRGAAGWAACEAADADDALLALWAAALHDLAGPAPLPGAWAASADRALAALAALRDPVTRVYRVAPADGTAFLMDNVEVEASLRDLARARGRRGDAAGAVQASGAARDLRGAMVRAFPAGPDGLLAHRLPPEPAGATRFYPEAVAHLYPWLHATPARWPGAADWRTWSARFGAAWRELRADPYPWGLVALAAHDRGDRAAALAWWRAAAALRGGPRWNVLEEVVWQALAPGRGEGACSIG